MTFATSLFIYSCIRASFLYWNWNQFKNMPLKDLLYAFFIGVRFDISSSGLLFLPLFLLTLFFGIWIKERYWKSFYFSFILLIQFPFWVLNYIDIEFFNFVGRRVTLSGLFIFTEAKGKLSSFFSTYFFWIIIIFILLFFYVFLLRRMVFARSYAGASKASYALSHFIILIFLVISARGGLQEKPIDFVHASVFNSPVMNNLTLNSTFSILKSFDKEKVSPVQFYTKEEDFFPYLNGYSEKKSLWEGHRPQRKQNVVIFLLESFALEFMGKPNHEKGYTPFLDEISEKGLFFQNSFANGRRSIEGVSSVLAGIPAMMNEPFISSEFASNYFLGAGSILEPLGYSTSFFHGGNNGTMYFDSFVKSAGIPKYFGAKEYPNPGQDHDKVWGIFDEPFLNFFGKELAKMPKPFFTMLFTLSSHHPYTIPDKLKGKFEKGPLEILESIQYTDYALKTFFETYQNEEWFKDTLFIFTADHTQKNLLPHFNNEIGRYRVPIIFYHPQFNLKKELPGLDLLQPIQHIDILPSVMDFLNLPMKQRILLSESVFKPDAEKYVVLFQDGVYLLIDKKYIVYWNQKDDLKFFESSDWGLKYELSKNVDEKIRTNYEHKLKSSVQYFNKGLWDNRLYFPGK